MAIVARGLGIGQTAALGSTPIVTFGLGLAQIIVLVPGQPAKILPSIKALAELDLTEVEAVVLEVTASLFVTLELDEEVHTIVLSEKPVVELELTEAPVTTLTLTESDC